MTRKTTLAAWQKSRDTFCEFNDLVEDGQRLRGPRLHGVWQYCAKRRVLEHVQEPETQIEGWNRLSPAGRWTWQSGELHKAGLSWATIAKFLENWKTGG